MQGLGKIDETLQNNNNNNKPVNLGDITIKPLKIKQREKKEITTTTKE